MTGPVHPPQRPSGPGPTIGLPRGFVFASIYLVAMPLTVATGYAVLTWGMTSGDEAGLAVGALGQLLITVGLLVVSGALVMSVTRPDMPVPRAKLRLAFTLGIVFTQLFTAFQLFISGSTATSYSGWLFIADVLGFGCFLTAWLMGHRHDRRSYAVAWIGALAISGINRATNAALSGADGYGIPDGIVGANFATVFAGYLGISAVMCATAWTAYGVERALPYFVVNKSDPPTQPIPRPNAGQYSPPPNHGPRQ